MAQKDILYYFDKINHKRYILGEVQKGFNMSFVIDGTKDSAKVQVIGFDESEIEPNTIIYHPITNSWWIVSHDKVERYYHEINYVYKHNLELVGAIELLNARDLTDCGFNAKTYTLEQFIQRLFKLSNFEFITITNAIGNCIDTNILVDYIKTFENYTLLSALRELLDGYNCSPKLRLRIDRSGTNYYIVGAYLDIYSKVGKGTIDFQESYFSNVKETKTMDKNSFGTIVVSNTENVVSTKAKTYPATSSVKLSSHEYQINRDNAILRLPSNIYKVNWLDMIRPVIVVFDYVYTGTHNTRTIHFVYYDFNKIKSQFIRVVNTWTMTGGTPVPNQVKEYFLTQADFFATQTMKAMTTRFWYNDNYDPVSAKYLPRYDVSNFYFPKITSYNGGNLRYNGEVVITNEELGNSVQNVISSIKYKRGSNEITHFVFLGDSSSASGQYSYLQNYDSTELGEINKQVIYYEYDSGTRSASCTFTTTNMNQFITPRNTYWRVNYIPMSDLKIKYDNSGESKDIQLYNQVGKLTDGVALSKLMLSYSKEIESDTITKYASGYIIGINDNNNGFNSLPNIGDSVNINNQAYIINNVSFDFYENESGDIENSNYDYYVIGEYTMSKWTSTKSLLTNPNTNIRDYGIPQNNNVARKQLYRDFYELAHTHDNNSDDDYYMSLSKIFNVSNYYKELVEHVAVMKLEFDQAYGGGGTDYSGEDVEPSDTWYYQLDTTTYVLKKSIYEVVNFNDNNIIGYSSQNVHSAWDIRRIFSGMTDNINTPISYVDDNGKVKTFNIAMCSNDAIATIYDGYLEEMKNKYSQLSAGFIGNLSTYSVFIPSEIYEGSSTSITGTITNTTTQTLNPTHATVHGDRVTRYSCNLFDIGVIPLDFSGTTSDITITDVSAVDENDDQITIDETTVQSGFNVRFEVHDDISNVATITFKVTYPYTSIAYFGAKDTCDFKIIATNYNKDAIEVPVFEYSCQIDDTQDVIVGENVFENENGEHYAYSYYLVDKNTINENTFNSITLEQICIDNDIVTNEPIAFWDKALKLDFGSNNNTIKISLYGECSKLNLQTQETPTYTNRITLTSSMFTNKDLVIARHKIPQYPTYEFVDPFYILNTTNELLFVIKNTQNIVIDDNEIVLQINHYTIS